MLNSENQSNNEFQKAIKLSNKLRSYKLDLLDESLKKRESYIHFIEFLITSSVTIGGALAALLDFTKVYLPLFIFGELLILVGVTLGILLRNKILNLDISGIDKHIRLSTDLRIALNEAIRKSTDNIQKHQTPTTDDANALNDAVNACNNFMNGAHTKNMHIINTTHISWLLITGLIVIFLSFLFSSFTSPLQSDKASFQFSGSGSFIININ